MSYRQFAEDELVLASHNPGKLREIAALFAEAVSSHLGTGL